VKNKNVGEMTLSSYVFIHFVMENKKGIHQPLQNEQSFLKQSS